MLPLTACDAADEAASSIAQTLKGIAAAMRGLIGHAGPPTPPPPDTLAPPSPAGHGSAWAPTGVSQAAGLPALPRSLAELGRAAQELEQLSHALCASRGLAGAAGGQTPAPDQMQFPQQPSPPPPLRAAVPPPIHRSAAVSFGGLPPGTQSQDTSYHRTPRVVC